MNFTTLTRILKRVFYLFMTIIPIIICKSVQNNRTHVEVEENDNQTDKPGDYGKGVGSEHVGEHLFSSAEVVMMILIVWTSVVVTLFVFLIIICFCRLHRGLHQLIDNQIQNFTNWFFRFFNPQIEGSPARQAGNQLVLYEGSRVNLHAYPNQN